MNKLSVFRQILVVGLFGTSQVQAATLNYSFQQNIVTFPSSVASPISDTALLSASYANLTVSDVPGGLDMGISVNNSFAGSLRSIDFSYIPQLGFDSIYVLQSKVDPSQIPNGHTYMYSATDNINGWGAGYSINSWKPISSILTFSLQNPVGDNALIHFRNLPSGVGAETFIPNYLNVVGADWGNFPNKNAYVLASAVPAVPEPSQVILMCAGLGVLAGIKRRRSNKA